MHILPSFSSSFKSRAACAVKCAVKQEHDAPKSKLKKMINSFKVLKSLNLKSIPDDAQDVPIDESDDELQHRISKWLDESSLPNTMQAEDSLLRTISFPVLAKNLRSNDKSRPEADKVLHVQIPAFRYAHQEDSTIDDPSHRASPLQLDLVKDIAAVATPTKKSWPRTDANTHQKMAPAHAANHTAKDIFSSSEASPPPSSHHSDHESKGADATTSPEPAKTGFDWSGPLRSLLTPAC
jgi:hypothetical protein